MNQTHTSFQQLPIVDVSGLFSDDGAQRLATARELDRAAREAGFFYVTGHQCRARSKAH